MIVNSTIRGDNWSIKKQVCTETEDYYKFYGFCCQQLHYCQWSVVAVDETERKQGNNPEQDLEDADFQPFQRK